MLLYIYEESQRNAKKIIQKKKREYLKRKVEQIEFLNQGFQPRIDACKNINGKVMQGAEVLDRWKEHFTDLLNRNSSAISVVDEIGKSSNET